MDTVRVMLPIIVMLVMGYIFQRTKLITESGMNGIKTYIVRIALPVTIFHAMATADLNGQTARIIIVMFLALSVSMGMGFVLRPFIAVPYKKYLPFLITVFEGGMFSYPLYQNLCGADRLVNIVIVDIAGCIFGFGIFYGILSLVEKETRFSIKTMAKVAVTSPTFNAVVLGLVCNVTGIMDMLSDSCFAESYLAVKELIVAPLTALILIYVGYSLKIEKKLIGICLKTIVLRIIVWVVLALIIMFVLKDIMQDKYMLTAFLIMFITPPTFSLPGFVEDKDAAGYFAMTTSIFVIVTVVAYAVVTAVMF